MLENAAVLGPSGNWSGLVKFGEELRQAPKLETLAALADAELLDVSGDRWTFRSESVRNVTYQTLTKAARAQRHAGVARAIEEEGKADQAAEWVAYHYAAAALLVHEIGPVHGVPPDVGPLAAAAFDLAATRALDQMVPTATVRLATEGLDVLAGSDPGEERQRRRLLLLRGRAMVEMHDAEPARADALAALAAARLAEDEVGVASAYALLAEVDVQAGRLDAAIASFTASVEAWRAVGDRRGLAETQRAWGFACLVSGALVEAERHLVEAQEVFAEEGDRRGQAWVDQHRAWIAFMRGDMAVAEDRLGHAEEAFRQLDDRGGLSWVQGLLAYVRFHQGRFAEAEELAVEVSDDAVPARGALGPGHDARPPGHPAPVDRVGAGVHRVVARRPGRSSGACRTASARRRCSDRSPGRWWPSGASPTPTAWSRSAARWPRRSACRASAPPSPPAWPCTSATATGPPARPGRRPRSSTTAARPATTPRSPWPWRCCSKGTWRGAAEVLGELPDEELGRPYGSAVAALVHAADGRLDEALAAAAIVAAAEGASYLDRVLALVGAGLATGAPACRRRRRGSARHRRRGGPRRR